jgi:soluble cytochrome b562
MLKRKRIDNISTRKNKGNFADIGMNMKKLIDKRHKYHEKIQVPNEREKMDI